MPEETPQEPLPNSRKRVCELRQARGLTLEALGARVGLSHQQISKIEKGKRQLRADEVLKFAAALGVYVEEIVTDRARLTNDHRRLLEMFDHLGAVGRSALLNFAGYLEAKAADEDASGDDDAPPPEVSPVH